MSGRIERDDGDKQLRFEFVECLREIQAIQDLARRFLPPASLECLRQFMVDLRNIQGSGTRKIGTWQIRQDRPVLTKPSRGNYERDGGGRHHVRAEITSIWEIEPVWEPGQRKRVPPREFAIAGKASTKVRLLEVPRDNDTATSSAEIAMWRMEIANFDSPGCYFHTQVLGELEVGPFPKTLSVPRLPGLVATPPAVLEFVLDELFQEGWLQEVQGKTSGRQMWNPIQKRRLEALFNWQLRQLEASTDTPWAVLKRGKPPKDLFLNK